MCERLYLYNTYLVINIKHQTHCSTYLPSRTQTYTTVHNHKEPHRAVRIYYTVYDVLLIVMVIITQYDDPYYTNTLQYILSAPIAIHICHTIILKIAGVFNPGVEWSGHQQYPSMYVCMCVCVCVCVSN